MNVMKIENLYPILCKPLFVLQNSEYIYEYIFNECNMAYNTLQELQKFRTYAVMSVISDSMLVNGRKLI